MEWNIWAATIRVLVCLPIVAGLAYFLIKHGMVKNFSRGGSQLKLLEQVSLQPKSTLSIVQAGNEYFLIGATEQSVNIIKELPDYQKPQENETFNDLNKIVYRLNRRSGGVYE